MRRDLIAIAGALAVQAALVAAIPLHESWIRATGRTILVAVDPVDPYEPLRGYHADFTYRGIDQSLPGFDGNAADGSSAWVLFGAPRRNEPYAPVRLVSSPAAAGTAPALRVRYSIDSRFCDETRKRAGCRTLRVTPNAWYADEASAAAIRPLLQSHQAVAELRVTRDGDASLMALRPFSPGMGSGG